LSKNYTDIKKNTANQCFNKNISISYNFLSQTLQVIDITLWCCWQV